MVSEAGKSESLELLLARIVGVISFASAGRGRKASGGGGCGVGVYRTPEGFQYKISSARGRLTDQDWHNIDPGIEPQVLIEKGPLATLMLFDGPFSMENLTSFYNLDRLSALMNAYYQ